MIDELLQKPYWIVDILPERVEKDSKAEEWCRENGYSIVYMDGSVPADQEDF